MNLKLTEVVSDITGKTGMTIIRAILAGERACRSRISIAPKILASSSRGEHTGRHDRTAKACLCHGER
jgi:hypothetical protein